VKRFRHALLSMLALAAPAAAGGLDVVPLDLASGPNTAQPSVAVDPGRGFIVTWQWRDGDRARLEFVEVAADGRIGRRGTIVDAARTGPEGAAARWFVNWADFPSLVVLDNGDWVAHWLQKSGDSTYAYEIRVVRSRDRGRSWSAPVVPHTDGTETEHGFVSLLPDGGDRVRLVWLDGRETAVSAGHDAHAGHGDHGAHGSMTLRSAVLDRRGRLSAETRLDADTCSCCQTDAVRHGERALVAYRDHGEGDLRNMHWLELVDGRWSADRVLHDDGWRIAGCPVNGPALAAGIGPVLAVWPTMQGERMVVRMAIEGAQGFGPAVDLEGDSGTVGRVDAAPWGDGFLVAWMGVGSVAGESALRLARVDATPKVQESRVLATLPPGRSSGVPRLAALGRVALAAWVEAADGVPTIRAARIVEASDAAPVNPGVSP
jgi:hypothetical protein